MIIDVEVEVTLGRSSNYYESLGYILPYRYDNRGRWTVPKGSKLTVKTTDIYPGTKTKVRCKCEDCGMIRSIEYESFNKRKNSSYNKSGETLCSKCANSRMSGKNNGQYKHGCNKYCEYRVNAKSRGHSFLLTVDEFRNIIDNECHYCGGYSTDVNPKSRGNGIDRVDSQIGYQLDNCVPCCFICNTMKGSQTYNDFLNRIKAIYERNKNEV